jgi:Ca2+-binding RTX toxin-like protein
VSITVTPENDAPTVGVAAVGSCGTNDRSGTINLTLSDPEGDAMSLTRVSNTNTTLVPNSNVVLGGTAANRTLTATAVSGRTGTAEITVRVSDGMATADLKLTVKVDGNGSRTTNGTTGPDLLFGQNGDDVLNGRAANDLLCGGRGNDTLNGNAGNDTMTGGTGADRFSGGLDTDRATDFTPSQGDTKDNTTEPS